VKLEQRFLSAAAFVQGHDREQAAVVQFVTACGQLFQVGAAEEFNAGEDARMDGKIPFDALQLVDNHGLDRLRFVHEPREGLLAARIPG
jgi:hypothetical protein